MRYRRLVAWMVALVGLCSWPLIALAQGAPVPAPDLPDPNAILDAFRHHSWVLLSATAVYWFTAFAKQGHFGPWLQNRLPKRAIPFITPVIGAVLLATGEIIAGRPWQSAMLDGFFSAILPVFGHVMLVESIMGGKEIVPLKAPAPPDAPPAAPRPVKITSMPPPPAAVVLIFGLGAIGGVLSTPGGRGPGGELLAAGAGCTPQERATAKTIADFLLTGTQLGCVEVSSMTTVQAVADVCKVDLQTSPGVEAFLDNLLAQKAAARRSGFAWHGPPPGDAGGP